MIDLDITEKEIFIECPRCQKRMSYLGKFPFRLGGMDGAASIFMSGLADANEKVVNFDVHRCKKCRKLEIFDLTLNLTY